MKAQKFLIINGPNLNMLGKREPNIYGSLTLSEIQEKTQLKLNELFDHVETHWYQSNVEGELINKIHQVIDEDYSALIINPGAYSHTSIALLDALKIIDIPVIEVHLTNTHKREEFRQVKLTAKAADIIMEGLGPDAYFVAICSQLNRI
ncbi:MAG: type II 3-dehydroquinate dehydratase [Bacteriovoracaceae bacterium]